MFRAAFIFICALLSLALARAEEVFQFTPHANVHVLHAAGTADGKTFVVGATDRPARLPGALRRFHGGGSGYHGFVSELDARGRGVASAVFGGRETWASHVAVAPDGDVVIAGVTTATNFPVRNARQATNAGDYDAFVIRFDPLLRTIRFATYLGTPGYNTASALAVDAAGNSFVVVRASAAGLLGTNAFDFGASTEAAYYHALVKLSPAGELLYASRLHAFSPLAVSALAVDAGGHAHLAGSALDGGMPTVNAHQPLPSGSSADAFVAKFTPDGRALVFATYLAGAGNDDARAIAVNAAGEIFVGGQTSSENFPDANDDALLFTPNRRAFVARYSPSGAWLGVQTLTASGQDIVEALALDGAGRVLVGGTIGARGDAGRSFVARLTGGEPIVPLHVGEDSTVAALLGSVSASGENAVFVSGSAPFFFPGARGVTTKVNLSNPAPWPPTVALLSLSPGSVVAPGQAIALAAAAFGGTGQVTAVSFYDGASLIGPVTNAPYQLAWTNTLAGPHRLTARATVSGVNVTSAPVTVTVASPVNDHFANRTRLRGERVNARGSVRGATADDAHDYSPNYVWWEWVAPRSGVFQIALQPAGQSCYVELYTGETWGELQREAFGYDGELTFRAQRGKAYQIGVASYSATTPEDFRLRLRPVAAPENDLHTRPQILPGLPASARGTLRHATADMAIYSGYDHDVWYEWTAPVAGSYLAWVESDETLPAVNVLRGQLPDSYFSIGRDVSGATNGQVFTALAGEKLLVRVFAYSSSPRFTLHLRAQPALGNDEFAHALELPTTGAVEANTIGATWNFGEPGQNYYDQFAWWKWTAPSSGVYRAQFRLTPRAVTAFFGPGIPLSPRSYSAVQVFTGDLWTGLVQVADFYGENGGAFRAVAGETYAVAVRGSYAHFTLGVAAVAPPANDDFAGAEILHGPNLAVSIRLQNATREPGEPGNGSIFPFGFDGNSVWYRWTAPEEGAYAFEVSSQVRLTVYAGDELAALQRLSSSSIRHTIRVAAGETLRLAVTQPSYSFSDVITLRLQKVTPPANDDFAQREHLTGSPVRFLPRPRHATLETNEPYATPGLLRTPSTVWYEWTAPFAGDFSLTTQSGYSGNWAVWRPQGESPEQMDGSRFPAEAGEIFHLVIFDYGNGSTVEPLVLQPASMPANDSFAQRIVLTGGVVRVRGTTVGATRETSEPFTTGNNTVWYSWTAPGAGRLLVEFEESYNAPTLRAFTGGALELLEPRPENDRLHDSEDPFDFFVEAGVTYQLVISADEIFNYEDQFRFALRFAKRPANDDFAQRARVFGSRASGTTRGATYEEGEGDGPTAFSGSTWWTWTAPRTGWYQIEVTSDFPLRDFGIYTGRNWDELEWALDDASLVGLGVWRFHATRGTAYALQLGTDEPGGSDYEFTIAPVRPPANDALAGAKRLRGSRVQARGSTRFASIEEEELNLTITEATRSVWWRWTAPADGMVFLELENVWQVVELYEGTNWNELIGWPASGSRIEAPVQAGVEYRFRVHQPFDVPPGNERVELSLRHERAPANDRFENRTTLTGTNVAATGTLVGATDFDEPPVIEEGYPTVWWRWMAPVTGRYTITARSTLLTPRLQVFLGDTRDDLTALPLAYPTSYLSQGNFLFQAGEVVAISVSTDELLARGGDIQVVIYSTGVPANDSFVARAELVAGRASSGVEGASREPGEPGFDEDPLGASLWWRFTPASNGWHLLSAQLTRTNDFYPGFAPQPELIWLNAFAGDQLENLEPLAFWTGEPQAQRAFLMAGQEYVLQVSDPQHRLGRVDVRAQYKPAPINDHFTNALVMTGEAWHQDFTNAWATAEPDEPVFPEGANSLWWRWTAPTGGLYQIYMNSYHGGVLRVHTGSELGALDGVVNVGSPFFPGYFPAEAGQTYHFSYRNSRTFDASVRVGVSRLNWPSALPSVPSVRALRVEMEPGRVIETSTNLVDWTPWGTNLPVAPLSVPVGAEPQRFFRVR